MSTAAAEIVFEHKHPRDGCVRFVAAGQVVRVDCRWPFDLDTSDWIYISIDIDLAEYRRSLGSFLSDGRGRASGLAGGFVTFKEREGGGVELELADRAASPTRLALMLDEDGRRLGCRLEDAIKRL